LILRNKKKKVAQAWCNQ